MGVTTKYPTKNDIYMSIMDPLVQAYAFINGPNPHEVWLASTLIELRTAFWGTNFPEGDNSSYINDGGGGGGVSNATCCKKKICTCNKSASNGARAAGGSGALGPNTARVQNLEKQLRNMTMSQPNAWQDWCAAVGYFYDTIGPFLRYFDYQYKNGNYSDFYRSAVGVIDRPGGYSKGLEMSLFQKGVNPGPGEQNEIFFINFKLADTSLADRFFILYDNAGLSYMLYYNLDGAGTFVPPAGLIPDALLPIEISTGFSAKEIQAATVGVLDATTLFSLKVTDFLLRVTYNNPEVIQDYNEGTSGIGINYEFNDTLLGSDGSTLEAGITNNEEYANAWNTLKVPFEATQGYTYPYLDPRIVGPGSPIQRAGGPCGACFRAVGVPVYGGDPGSGPSGDSPNGPTGCRGCNSAASASIFRTTAYDMFTNPTYNTPGNIFIASEGRQSRLIDNSQIV